MNKKLQLDSSDHNTQIFRFIVQYIKVNREHSSPLRSFHGFVEVKKENNKFQKIKNDKTIFLADHNQEVCTRVSLDFVSFLYEPLEFR